MKLKFTLLSLLVLFTISSKAQFSIDAELRPRTEYRHGFGTLIAKDAEPGYGISTRARLNFGYKADAYEIFMSMQDVMVWGENRQILPKDLNNSFAIFQAWANIKLGENMSTKLGRQVLSYDDQRIMGGLDWAQQGRNHDAILLKYNKNKFLFDLGFAFNQDYDNISGFQSSDNTYYTKGFFSYKTMQYGYFKNTWGDFSGSLLLLNNGFQNYDVLDNQDGISNLQTFGVHLNYGKKLLGVAGNLYMQTGERQGEIDVKGAYLASLDFTFKTNTLVNFGLGAEIISGNDGDAGETGAFFPLYGTNHKFNGFMDYFYVGNHANSIGLVDFHVSANFTLNKKSSLLVKVLNFSGEQELLSGEKSLGTELDIVYALKLNGFTFKAGYSQMFESDGMYELKGLDKNLAANTQNWAWAMLVFKPKFL
ncbi:Alginate export [Lutibacter agarilyticus]|uniref:Alginate export n=1 Tax=Lutibacter agarilyticus TaxID=1109740 RepID=A0A238XV43_9FLAO|nr:alginate export family protein [Lutibacter agarilyticus]SNR62293.1 Alginate export [Lutibacter agarilyticus]